MLDIQPLAFQNSSKCPIHNAPRNLGTINAPIPSHDIVPQSWFPPYGFLAVQYPLTYSPRLLSHSTPHFQSISSHHPKAIHPNTALKHNNTPATTNIATHFSTPCLTSSVLDTTSPLSSSISITTCRRAEERASRAKAREPERDRRCW
jgi:hypothetical protein